MQQGCGSGAAGPPHTTAGGGGRAAAAGPRRPRGGFGTENVPRLACLRPAGGGGASLRFGWARRTSARRGARARACFFFFRAVTRALCGPPVARSRSTCAFPLALSCGPWARTASGARASPRPPVLWRAPCCWFGCSRCPEYAQNAPSERRVGGLADDRLAEWGRLRVGPLPS